MEVEVAEGGKFTGSCGESETGYIKWVERNAFVNGNAEGIIVASRECASKLSAYYLHERK